MEMDFWLKSGSLAQLQAEFTFYASPVCIASRCKLVIQGKFSLPELPFVWQIVHGSAVDSKSVGSLLVKAMPNKFIV